MIVPDLNLLLYAVHKEGPLHARAMRWLQDILTGDEPVGLPWSVTLGFVRLTTNARIFTTPIAVGDAIGIVDGWFRQRIVSPIEPGQEHWRIVRGLLAGAGAGGNLTTDAHIAALCIERGAVLHSADADFTRFPGLRFFNPLSAPPGR